MKIRMAATLLAMLTLLSLPFQANALVYNESGGLVVMEAENTESPLDLWQEQNSLANYTGDGYVQFLGNNYASGPAGSPLEYTFKINQPGLYYLHLHAAKTNIHDGVEWRTDVANDCYVRVEGDYTAGPAPYTSPGDNASLSLLSSDTKYYTYTEQATDQWKWENGTGNGEGSLDPTSGGKRVAVYDFKAGETYTLVVSGRSKFFRLNRIMFRHTSVGTSAAQNLSNPESDPVVAETYTYAATTDFPSYTNGVVPYYIHGAEDALAIAANIIEYRDKFATAERTFEGEAGTYDVTITALRELDGECIYRFLVNSNVVGTVQNSETTVDYAPQKHVFRNISIPAGATIAVESKTDSNGKVLEDPEVPGVYAWARGRWREVSLAPSSLSIVQPPDGRIALVSDGNSPDPDDIGAKAVAFGILKASGYSDRLVHVSHSCDLDPFSGGSQTIDVPNELRRQAKLHELTGEGFSFFGPFPNVTDYFNCRSNQTEAVSNLTAAIDASSVADPLWIIEAGEPDIIGFALSNAVPSKRQYVHVISHHPANDNSGDYVTWAEILAYGVTEHQIGDQNVGLKTGTNDWDWAYQHSDPGIDWIYQQLRYAEQDGVVTFQTDKFDCSDAGMLYWWLTGADSGGNSNSTPVEMKAMLLNEEANVPPVSDVITLVNLGSAVNWTDGANWSDGLPAHTGADYLVPATGNLKGEDGTSTFPGNSLTILPGAKLQVRSKDTLGQATTVNSLVFSNGTSFASGPKLAPGTGSDLANVLDGSMINSGYTRFMSYHAYSGGTISRSLTILSMITGDGQIQAWEASAGYGGENVIIDNAANTFSGTWQVGTDTTLVFNNAGAVGSADIEVLDSGKLQILGDWNTYANLAVADTATTSIDLGSNVWKVTSLSFGGVAVADGTNTAAQLNALGANSVFTGSGTIVVGAAPAPPPAALVAGWDTWDSATTPSASVLALNVTASAVTTTEQLNWNTVDERGASNDGTWGTHVGPPVASSAVVDGENLELPNATTGGTITFTINNNGATDIELAAFHFDAYAFRPKAARTYQLSVLPGGGISDGVIYTSGALEITSVGGADDNNAHDDMDHSLTGLADHTLAAGESVQFLLAFSGGVGDGSGGHDLWVDNVAVSQVITVSSDEPPVLDLSMSGGDMVFNWSESGFKVQSRTNLTEGTWADVPGGDTPPVNMLPSNSEAFFRLVEQ